MKLVRLLFALLLLFGAATAHAQSFPKLTGRVVDAANLLDPAQEAQLTQLSADIEKASGRQFVVATIPDLEGYEIEEYGYKLGRTWKIGQSEADNGIILIVAPKERKVRIEVGYGLEPVMTDALSGMIIRDTILPKFRDGDMAGGIMAGAAAIGEQMKLPLEAAEARAKQQLDSQRAHGGKHGNNDGVGVLIAIFWVVVFFAIILPMIVARRRYGRRYRGGNGVANILLWSALDAAMRSGNRGGSSWGGGGSSWGGGGGSSWGGGGGGGFSGGGGSFGGGGASGGW